MVSVLSHYAKHFTIKIIKAFDLSEPFLLV